MIRYLMNKLKKSSYIIEYRWLIEESETLWVIYRKFKCQKERDDMFEKISLEKESNSYVEFKRGRIEG